MTSLKLHTVKIMIEDAPIERLASKQGFMTTHSTDQGLLKIYVQQYPKCYKVYARLHRRDTGEVVRIEVHPTENELDSLTSIYKYLERRYNEKLADDLNKLCLQLNEKYSYYESKID